MSITGKFTPQDVGLIWKLSLPQLQDYNLPIIGTYVLIPVVPFQPQCPIEVGRSKIIILSSRIISVFL